MCVNTHLCVCIPSPVCVSTYTCAQRIPMQDGPTFHIHKSTSGVTQNSTFLGYFEKALVTRTYFFHVQLLERWVKGALLRLCPQVLFGGQRDSQRACQPDAG